MIDFFANMTSIEEKIFKKLNTPEKIQDFLDKLPINFEKKGDTVYSPRVVLLKREAHCFEGSLLASAILWYHGAKPLILDLKAGKPDDHHTVALFNRKGLWGAISKTNHAVLRYRDPVYTTPRELVMSYFHEYFLDNGRKTLRSFAVYDLRKIKRNWITDDIDLWYVDRMINKQKHEVIFDLREIRNLRKASLLERKVGKIVEWN